MNEEKPLITSALDKSKITLEITKMICMSQRTKEKAVGDPGWHQCTTDKVKLMI